MRRLARLLLVVLVPFVLVIASAGPSFAHGEMTEPSPVMPPGMDPMMGHHPADLGPLQIAVMVPETGRLGEKITVLAKVTGPNGAPGRNAMVTFQSDAAWGEMGGHMIIGAVMTDAEGMATLSYELRRGGEVTVDAVAMKDGFGIGESDEVSVNVTGTQQLYWPSVGLKIPGLSFWILAAVVAIVWSLYVMVVARLVAIARPLPITAGVQTDPLTKRGQTRRQFLTKALPLGADVGIAAIGGMLVTLIARSPRTHGNLAKFSSHTSYRRTPFAVVGESMPMNPMPAVLDRPVSFGTEVLPIFMSLGGPHVVLPENQPPPGGLRLDSYEGVMGKEGVVVPGRPDESELMNHLLSPGMQMPPSTPPLPEDKIQLVASWIAQGAPNN